MVATEAVINFTVSTIDDAEDTPTNWRITVILNLDATNKKEKKRNDVQTQCEYLKFPNARESKVLNKQNK